MMKLIDRIVLVSLLPKEGSFETLIILDDIRKKAGVTQDEVVEFKINSTDKGVTWTQEAAEKEFDIDFTEAEKNEVSKMLKKLSDDEKLNTETINLYKIFVK